MSPRRLRFGLKVAQMGGTFAEIRDAWLEADRLGFDTAWAHDHLLNQNDPSKNEDEGWTLLASLLTEARRIRGGLMVTANTFRHPAVLAKIATTVDVVSHGRVEVGLGAGWHEDEHQQYGLPLPPLGERMRRLEEACQILRALWTEKRATVEGTYYQVREAFHEPKPVQRPHPPIVLGTSGEKVGLRITARHAQEWNMSKGTPAEFRRLSEIARRLLPRGGPRSGGDPALHPVRGGRPPERRGRADRALARVRRGGGDPPHLHVPHPVQRGRRPPRLERGRHAPPRLTLAMDGSAGALVLWILAAGLVLVGIAGTVLPGLPGAILVLAGLALAAWIDGFARVGLGTLAVLAALTAATYALDLVATAVGARRFGTSWWGVLGAVAGAMVGLFFGLPGLVLGPFLGAFAAELVARAGRAAGRPRRRRRVARPPPGDRGAPRPGPRDGRDLRRRLPPLTSKRGQAPL